MTLSKNLQLFLPADMAALATAGQSVREFLAGTPLNEATRSLLEVAVVEAITNVIRHGSTGSSADTAMELNMAALMDRVEATLVDHGTPIPQATLDSYSMFLDEPDRKQMNAISEHGMGLGIIFASADFVEYEPEAGRNTLRMTKYYGAGE